MRLPILRGDCHPIVGILVGDNTTERVKFRFIAHMLV